MALIILIPASICCVVLAMTSARRALLAVYLPALLLLPQYYVLRLKHLPPLTFADMAILPLGIAIVMTEMRRWRWSPMDLFVGAIAFSQGISEALSAQLANGDWVRFFSPELASSAQFGTSLANGALFVISAVLTIVLPYMLGKTLLEQIDSDGQPMRLKVIRRTVSLLAVVGLLSLYDFLRGASLWQRIFSFLKPYQNEVWEPQVRWGFGRIQGPFGHAILAGMIFLMGLVYCLWLRRVNPQWGARRVVAGLPFTLRGVGLAAVVLGLFMTQSRGPWIGVGLALVFAFLTRHFPIVKAALIFVVFLAIFGSAAYVAAKHYTDRDLRQAQNMEQQNAIYRRQLLTNYVPMVKERPLFGWGITDYPKVNGQDSIDNEFLLLAVTQGFFGLAAFLAIVLGTAGRLLQFLIRPMQENDRLLVFAHMSVLIGLVTTLSTVYMGEQVVMLFFMVVGWVQAMQPARAFAGAASGGYSPLHFRRVLV